MMFLTKEGIRMARISQEDSVLCLSHLDFFNNPDKFSIQIGGYVFHFAGKLF